MTALGVKKYWMGTIPNTCDTCGMPIQGVFFDAATKRGPWACMCPTCHTLGPGKGKTGPGLGQKYEKQKDGKYLKVEG